MKALVVNTKDESEYKFVTDLLKKPGIGTATLTRQELEGIGLLKLMHIAENQRK